MVHDSAFSDFLSEDAGHVNGPGRFDIRPWISKLRIVISGLRLDLLNVRKPVRMMSQLRLLQNYPSLRGVNVGLFGAKELFKEQLVHTSQSVSFSRRDIHKRLGRGLKFEFGLRCHQCESGGNGGECARHYLNWSGRYVGFKEMHESIMDDHTR